MRILYVVPAFPAPSETFVAEEVIGVRRRGADIRVAALSRPSADQRSRLGPRLRELADGATYLPRLPLGPGLAAAALRPDMRALNAEIARRSAHRTSGLARLARAAAVAQLARAHRADLIYAHWPRPSEVALLAHRLTGIPVAFSVHAHEVAHDGGHFGLAFEAAEFLAFCNRAAMEHLLGSLPDAARSKAHLVYHGVDFSDFPPAPMPAVDGPLRIVSAGRLTPTKGFDRLIEAVSLARAQGVPVELNILGEGGQKAELEALVRRLGLEGEVRLLGWTPHEAMAGHLAAAHAFALLADVNFHDGLPNVVLEALAVGRPAVVSPLPAAAEAVHHGRNGYVLSAKDALQEFVDLCRSWRERPELLSSMGAEAARLVREEHDRNLQLDRLTALFESTRRPRGL